jgi:hypothetical protein
VKVWESGYATFYNNPNSFTDILGLTGTPTNEPAPADAGTPKSGPMSKKQEIDEVFVKGKRPTPEEKKKRQEELDNAKGRKADEALTKWFDKNNVSWYRPERLIHNGGAIFFGTFGLYSNSRILDIHLQLSPFSDPYNENSKLKPHWIEYQKVLKKGNTDFFNGFLDDQMGIYIKAHNIDLSKIVDVANNKYYKSNKFSNDVAGNIVANSFLFGAYNFGTIFNAPVESKNIKTINIVNNLFIHSTIPIKYNPKDWTY